jgi:hypothetical protein
MTKDKQTLLGRLVFYFLRTCSIEYFPIIPKMIDANPWIIKTPSRMRIGKIMPNICELPTNIEVPTLRHPSPRIINLNESGWPLGITPWNILPNPLNITLSEMDNNNSGILGIVTGDRRAIVAKINASAPSIRFET